MPTVSRPLRARWAVAVVAIAAAALVPFAPADAASKPSAPRSLTATSLHESVRLSWKAPSKNGGAALRDYVVLYRRADTVTWSQFLDRVSTATTTTVTGLADWRAYQFKVAAVNRAGQGTFSPVVLRTPGTLPGPPNDLVSGFQGAGAALEWGPPTSNGGSPVTDYRIQHKRTSAKTWMTYADGVSTATSASVPVNGDYLLRVAAINAAGAGPYATVALRIDSDEDTYFRPADCNDHAPAIHPGAVEVLGDGLDNDCDRTTDDGTSPMDEDGDAWSIADGDCNDHAPAIHPGATEILGDGIDNDCDGTSDARP